MKITKTQLKQIIKEELQVLEVAQFKGGPEVDIQDAIQMLEADFDKHDEVGAGTLYHVINRLYEALAKLGVDGNEAHDEETLEAAAALGLDPADYPAPGELEAAIHQRM